MLLLWERDRGALHLFRHTLKKSGKEKLLLTQEEELEAEEQIQWYVVSFCLGDKKEGEEVEKSNREI